MPKNRWGGASGPATGSKKPSRIRRAGARARDWADDKTGRRMSTGWRAARKEKGFKARRRAAGQAVREAGGGGIIAAIVGVFAALFAGIAGFSRGRADAHMDGVDPNAKEKTTETPTAASGGIPADYYTPPSGKGAPHFGPLPGGGIPMAEYADPGHAEPEAETSTPTSTTTPTGGTTMSRNLPHATAAADLSALIAKHSPEDLFEVIDQADEWETWVQDTTMSIKRYVQQIQGKNIPLGKNSIQAIQELYVLQSKLMTAAQEIPKTMRAEHATDLERREHHRGDERLSNIR